MSFSPKTSKMMMTSLACSFFALPTVAVDAPANPTVTTPAVATSAPVAPVAPIAASTLPQNPQNHPHPQALVKTTSPALGATPATATLSTQPIQATQPVQAPSSETIGKAAVEYFKAHPEAFVEVIAAVQAHAQQTQEKAQAEKITKHGTDLFNTTTGTPYLGNPTGTTEVVLFMDPFCHFCRKFEPVLFEAIKADPTLKIVSRDIAIMNEKSALLIKAALAASKQGKYAEMMQAVHKLEPTVTEKDLVKIAKSLKLNVEIFKTDMASPEVEAQIKANMDMAQNLEITGTPTFIAKSSQKIVSGYMPLEAFQQALKGPEAPQAIQAPKMTAQQNDGVADTQGQVAVAPQPTTQGTNQAAAQIAPSTAAVPTPTAPTSDALKG